ANSAVEMVRKSLDIFESLAAADSKNVGRRRDLGFAYQTLGEVYEGLAKAPATPTGRRKAYWREARMWYQRALDLFVDMRTRGILRGSDADNPDKLDEAIARCDDALK